MSQSEAVIGFAICRGLPRFLGRPKVRRLNALSLDIRKGEVFGCWAKRFRARDDIKLLLGLLFPRGRDSDSWKVGRRRQKNERIGYLPEESYFTDSSTLTKRSIFTVVLFHMNGCPAKRAVQRSAGSVKLAPQARRGVKEYSKGMTVVSVLLRR